MLLSGSLATRPLRPIPALVVGHPGHELKVFGWMSQFKPRVFVITDGSGQHGTPRIASTRALVRQIGAEEGEIFGGFSDVRIYAAILGREYSLFKNILHALTRSFLINDVNLVAGDAAEGYNPTHDICRALINGALTMAKQAAGRTIDNYQFCLTEWEQNTASPHDGQCRHFHLDDKLLSKKLKAAEQYVELRDEVRRATELRGVDYFRLECLRKAVVTSSADSNSHNQFYETCGERRVAEGKYQTVIRYKEHMAPLFEAISQYASRAALDETLCARG